MSGTTGWGYYQQGSDQMQEIDELGARLSIILKCPVHYPAWGKDLFECVCGKIFPVFVVRYAHQTENWAAVIAIHLEK